MLVLILYSTLLGTSGAAQAQTRHKTILVLGDSLSAEYGLSKGSGWASLLAQKLAAQKSPYQVVNASISGDTTSGGRSRLAPLLVQHKPSVVIIELGGNDALRGLDIRMTQTNLAAMSQTAKQSGAKVLLVPMQIPPNYGAEYAAQFKNVFAKVAKSEKVAIAPFFLKGVADQANLTDWFQADRIHPNERAQPKLLENVWPSLAVLLK